MNKPTSYSFLLVFMILIITGCSSTKSTPVIPVDPQTDINLPVTELSTSESSRSILGAWTLSINHETLEATVTPNRSLDRHYNVKYLIPTPEVVINTIHPNYVIDADVTLTNPYTFPAYDIRLIIFTDEYGHFLDNADAWTDLYDIPVGQDINPFKAYAKDQPNRIFEGETSHTENLLVFDPPPGHPIQFAIDASHPGNCEEPYAFENFQQGMLYENVGSQATISLDVLDWQDDVSEVSLQCPEITGQPVSAFEHIALHRWNLTLANNTGVHAGEYAGYLVAKSINSGALALYDRVSITVTIGSGSSDTDPPQWESTVGITDAVVNGRDVIVHFGNAVDSDSPPVKYLIFIDEDDYPWDQFPIETSSIDPYVFENLQDGLTYWFGVRCRDSASPPNADTNTVVRSVEILDTFAPVWENTIGILNAVWGNEQVRVEWGLALDPCSPPVVYQVYMDEDNDPWDQIPLEFTSNDPYVFSGLENGTEYWFGVRCRDSAIPPNLDLNDNVLSAIPCENTPDDPYLISSYDNSIVGYSSTVCHDDLAYVFKSEFGFHHVHRRDRLKILDISEPEEPVIIASFDYPVSDWKRDFILTTDGNYLYITGNNDDTDTYYLKILDVSDPHNVHGVYSTSGHGEIVRSSLSGNILCLSGNKYGSWFYSLLDVSNPSLPVIESVNIVPEYITVYAHDGYAYYAVADSLYIVDISDPQQPEIISDYQFSDDLGYIMAVKDGFIYTYKPYSLYIDIFALDARDVYNPVFASETGISAWVSHEPTFYMYDSAFSEDKLYFTYHDNEQEKIQIIHIDDPYNIYPEWMFGGTYYPQKISFVKDSYLYSTSYMFSIGGLSIHHDSDPSSLIRSFAGFYPTSIEIKGNYAYCGNYDQGNIIVFNISNPDDPQIVTEYYPGGSYRYSTEDIAVENDRLYIAHGDNGVVVADISDPANPVTLNTIDINNTASTICVKNQVAYVGFRWSSECVIVDLSDPMNPIIYDTWDGQPYIIEIQGDFLYVTSLYNRYFKIYNITNPVNPMLAGEWDASEYRPREFSLKGNIAYVIDQSHHEFYSLDISDPQNAYLVSRYPIPYSSAPIVNNGDFLYVPTRSWSWSYTVTNEMYIYYEQSLGNVDYYNKFTLASAPVDMVIENNYLYTVCKQYGFSIYQLW